MLNLHPTADGDYKPTNVFAVAVLTIEYNDFNSHNQRWEVRIMNSHGQKWDFRRIGISEEDVRALVKGKGKTEAIKELVRKGALEPFYGGNMHLDD